jgi:XTP/dITP diphosphohydrolase
MKPPSASGKPDRNLQTFVLASGSRHKLDEFGALARGSHLPVQILSADLAGGMPPVVEDAGTFLGNAEKKARALWRRVNPGWWVLADDSGLSVEALGGAPGVESAYYAGPQGDPAANLLKLVAAMREVPEGRRGAHFTCVLALIDPTGAEHRFEGRCEGDLLYTPRGVGGFGYDPLFVPRGYDQSFAELGEEAKNHLSHRARAWRKLAEWFHSLGPAFPADDAARHDS